MTEDSEDTWEEWDLTIHSNGTTQVYNFATCLICKAMTLREDAFDHSLWHQAMAEGR